MTRLRDLGIRIGAYEPGPYNAITDVAGVRVGQTTIIDGDGPLVVGEGPVRTGVTVIQPRPGYARDQPAFAGAYSMNGNGEFTGMEWIRESGLLTTPIGLTNSHSVGALHDALIAYETRNFPASGVYWSMPAVAETNDCTLNDTNGQHVKAEHVFAALEAAVSGPVAEGNTGGGTGMICHQFKGGTGTSSRRVPIQAAADADADAADADADAWTVGVLVQANYGVREELRVDGVPVGKYIPLEEIPPAVPYPARPLAAVPPPGAGSIIVIVATDAPLLPGQCRRLALRAGVGLSRVGGGASEPSGDIMLAFATGNTTIPPEYYRAPTPQTHQVTAVAHQHLGPLFEAASDATEEAIVNALLAAETMIGRDGHTAHGLDPDRLTAAMAQYAADRPCR